MPNRIKLKENFRIKLFNSILSEQNRSLLELSKKLNCGYSGIKNWRSGKRLIPEDVFNLLLEMSNLEIRKEVRNNIDIYPQNWGYRLGGLRSYAKIKRKIYSKMKFVRSFKKHRAEIPIVDDNIWEIFGVCLGDGCLSKYFSNYNKRLIYEVIFTGNLKDDKNYYQDKIIPILRSKFNLNTKYYQRLEDNSISIRIKSKKIFNYFKKLGMPVGKKKYKIKIPVKIFKSSSSTKAAILRGLLDTDGCIFARKDENYRYLSIKITSINPKFLNQLKVLIRQFKLPAYIHGDSVWVRGNENIKMWMQKIGSSHPIVNERYKAWIRTGKLLPKNTIISEINNI